MCIEIKVYGDSANSTVFEQPLSESITYTPVCFCMAKNAALRYGNSRVVVTQGRLP
jgi:hypothetical protein